MKKVEMKIRRVPSAGDLPLPSYMSEGASGMDLHAAVDVPVEIPPGGRALISAGFSMAIPPGFEAQIRPRSGLARSHGITVLNTPGTVDADYRGEVGVILLNCSRESFTVRRGMRIAQMVIQSVVRADVSEVEELPGSPRAGGGFGHTGI